MGREQKGLQKEGYETGKDRDKDDRAYTRDK